IARLPGAARLECRLAPAAFPFDRGFWKRVWAQRILGRAERDQFRRLRTPETRQLEWLAGRTAAKEAVQQLLREHYGLELRHADVEIAPDAQGRPLVDGAWRNLVERPPVVSIAHTAGWAVALAALDPSGRLRLGIDVERVRPRGEGFADLAFTE